MDKNFKEIVYSLLFVVENEVKANSIHTKYLSKSYSTMLFVRIELLKGSPVSLSYVLFLLFSLQKMLPLHDLIPNVAKQKWSNSMEAFWTKNVHNVAFSCQKKKINSILGMLRLICRCWHRCSIWNECSMLNPLSYVLYW